MPLSVERQHDRKIKEKAENAIASKILFMVEVQPTNAVLSAKFRAIFVKLPNNAIL